MILLRIGKHLLLNVELKGYKHGGNRNSSVQSGHLNLDEIAKELNMSTGNLRRVWRIERNLTDSMKDLHGYYVLIISCVKDFWGNLER